MKFFAAAAVTLFLVAAWPATASAQSYGATVWDIEYKIGKATVMGMAILGILKHISARAQ